MRWLTIAAALGASALGAQPASRSADSAAIAALEQRVEDAVAQRDAAFLEGVYAPTFRFRHSTGWLEDRATRMRIVRETPAPGAPRVISRTVDSLEVEPHEDVALTTGRIFVRRDDPKVEGPGRLGYTVRYARVYQRRGGRWQLLTHHSTHETQGPPPAAAPAMPPAEDRIHRLAEMNTEQIRALDRARTVVVMPGGVLEEHGPYLPSYTDGYFNQRLAADLAAAIVARPGWSVLMFPEIPLGAGGANEIGNKPVFPGSYTVRTATLRAVYMDLATELGDQGFRWIFVVNLHGGPDHNNALDEAGDYFRDSYGGRMVHLAGILLDSPLRLDSILSPAAAREDGFTVHAGAVEHARIMALRPDLVPSSVRGARSITGTDMPDLIRLARLPDWPGYFGAPRHASAELGRASIAANSRTWIAVALRILDGADERAMPRLGAARTRMPALAVVRDSSAKRDADMEARQSAWLARRKP